MLMESVEAVLKLYDTEYEQFKTNNFSLIDKHFSELLEMCDVHYTLYHAGGTCKIGPKSNPEALIDERLKIYGIDDLRIVDVSIILRIVKGEYERIYYYDHREI
ncbi:unnamed protein product [Heterotrigona itama]|uniref:Glucose-methanol-choline oxidoreductase C-terminal domain-containing protein n=1 Tax=Heterotrigona itama TaxID=395501 RepID=A0A6V7HIZ1_9HYME|nr:unnamed protein product [Heterotrigona itama]